MRKNHISQQQQIKQNILDSTGSQPAPLTKRVTKHMMNMSLCLLTTALFIIQTRTLSKVKGGHY